MAKKASGLGRGLGDLMEDNAPVLKRGGTVVRKDEAGATSVTPPAQPKTNTTASGVVIQPKGLYDGLPKPNSFKSNFKNYNKNQK